MEDKQLIKLLVAGNTSKFYKSRRWKALRLQALERDNNECQQCKERGYFHVAECVHHIKEVKEVPQLALTLSNLKSLCNKCHNITHGKCGSKKIIEKKFINEERW